MPLKGTPMEHLLVVAVVLAIATLATGIVLPITTRHGHDPARRVRVETALADELAASRR
jgi:hypothetical protein